MELGQRGVEVETYSSLSGQSEDSIYNSLEVYLTWRPKEDSQQAELQLTRKDSNFLNALNVYSSDIILKFLQVRAPEYDEFDSKMT